MKTNRKFQVGGDHYTKLAIQPTYYALANGLGVCEANVIKYVSRWKSKNGLDDLRKARDYLDILTEWELENEQQR